MLQAIYNCRMSELYTIARLGWANCKTLLTDFTAMSAQYNLALVAARRAEIDAAEALPDFQARTAAQELLRISLVDQLPAILGNFQLLKRYISYAFPANQYTVQIDAAGQGYYLEASSENWDSAIAMCVSAENYMTANSIALLANNNMPAGFQAAYLALIATFNSTYVAYETERLATLVDTETKVAANNQLYTNLISMFKDAQYISAFTDAQKQAFIFSKNLQLVSGAGLGGFGGTVTDATTLGAGVAGATVDIITLGITAVTQSNGTYSFNSVPAGTYTVEISAAGYQTQQTSVTITNAFSTIDFQLQP